MCPKEHTHQQTWTNTPKCLGRVGKRAEKGRVEPFWMYRWFWAPYMGWCFLHNLCYFSTSFSMTNVRQEYHVGSTQLNHRIQRGRTFQNSCMESRTLIPFPIQGHQGNSFLICTSVLWDTKLPMAIRVSENNITYLLQKEKGALTVELSGGNYFN